jgi:hypothetical protein
MFGSRFSDGALIGIFFVLAAMLLELKKMPRRRGAA